MSDSETPQKKKDTGKSRKRKNNSTDEEVAEQNHQWSLDEKQRFVTGLYTLLIRLLKKKI